MGVKELYIPGFRSGVSWKKIVASIYYIFIIYSCIHSWGMVVFFLAAPFAVFSFADILKLNKSILVFDKTSIVFILSLSAMIIGGYGVYRSFFNKHIERDACKFESIHNAKGLDEILRVHFLGIGQGDSILIQQGVHSMLIDAGYRVNGRSIVKYLKNCCVEKFDYIVITHPHPDHIGGLADILWEFDVDRIIMPCVEYAKNNYKNVMRIIEEDKIEIILPVPGRCYELGRAHFQILAPNSSEYARLNNYSVVMKMVFAYRSFLFTGDAEKLSEYEMLLKGFDLEADVLKVGHHGSSTSSSLQFLRAVSPKHAVLSTGWHSFYGHPDKVTLDNIKSIGACLYRTDKNGNIVAISDGHDIIFNKEPVPIDNDSFMKNLNKRKVITRIKERHKAIF